MHVAGFQVFNITPNPIHLIIRNDQSGNPGDVYPPNFMSIGDVVQRVELMMKTGTPAARVQEVLDLHMPNVLRFTSGVSDLTGGGFAETNIGPEPFPVPTPPPASSGTDYPTRVEAAARSYGEAAARFMRDQAALESSRAEVLRTRSELDSVISEINP